MSENPIIAVQEGLEAEDPSAGSPSPSSPIEFIGPYSIVRPVSETPTSAIYKAEHRDSKRRVAIRVIFGGSSSRSNRRIRPEEEIQRLRHMSHPGIASFVEMGRTPEGHIYFVNEFVRGVPLNEYVAIHKLGLKHRLLLFLKFCEAVHYAHQNLLLHRDLRPSKIVIDGKGMPKIVGLGVAAVTNVDLDSALNLGSREELRPFLVYKSPEQVTGKLVNVDVRSDLYSLGVILYELLTDQLPCGLDACAEEEITRAICSNRAKISNDVRRRIGDDLAAIALKTLEKDPEARYQTVAALSQDLQAYFDNRPVSARTPGAAYELSKLVSRYKVRLIPVAIGTLAVLAFGGHVHLMTRQADRELIQGMEAQAAREMAAMVTAREILEEKLKIKQAEGEMEGARREADLERLAQLESQVQEAADNAAAVAARATAAEARVHEAETVSEFLLRLFQTPPKAGVKAGQTTVEEILENGVREAESRYANAPERLATMLDVLGIAYQNLGSFKRAGELIRSAVETRRAHFGAEHEATLDAMNNLAASLFSAGEFGEAEAVCLSVVEAAERQFGSEDPKTLTAMHNLAMTYHAQKKYDKAEKILRATLDGRRRVLGELDPKTARSMQHLAMVLLDQEKILDSLEVVETLRQTTEGLSDSELADAAELLVGLAEALMEAGHLADAEPLLHEAVQMRRKVLAESDWRIAQAEGALGHCLLAQQRFEEAEPLLVAGFNRLKGELGGRHEATVDGLLHLIELYEATGNRKEAARYRAMLP